VTTHPRYAAWRIRRRRKRHRATTAARRPFRAKSSDFDDSKPLPARESRAFGKTLATMMKIETPQPNHNTAAGIDGKITVDITWIDRWNEDAGREFSETQMLDCGAAVAPNSKVWRPQAGETFPPVQHGGRSLLNDRSQVYARRLNEDRGVRYHAFRNASAVCDVVADARANEKVRASRIQCVAIILWSALARPQEWKPVILRPPGPSKGGRENRVTDRPRAETCQRVAAIFACSIYGGRRKACALNNTLRAVKNTVR